MFQQTTQTVESAIKELTYDYLEEADADWYNNDGGYGALTIEVSSATLSRGRKSDQLPSEEIILPRDRLYVRKVLQEASQTRRPTSRGLFELYREFFGGAEGVELELPPCCTNRPTVDLDS